MKKIISILMAILMVVSVVPLTAFAEEAVTIVDSGSCGANGDNVTWTLESDGTLTISGEGKMADYADSGLKPWSDYLISVKKLVVSDNITAIGDFSFRDCTSLEELEIGADVTRIGESAFENCESLKALNIPSDVTIIEEYVFCNCKALQSITIGEGLQTISDSAFNGCESLGEIVIPENITAIGFRAFAWCTNLEKVTFSNNLKTISDDAFWRCDALTSIYIPASVVRIVNNPFDSCGLVSIVVDKENSVYDSRNNCNAIIETKTNKLVSACTNTVLPDELEAIGNSAFSGCEGLYSVVIPESVHSIGRFAFSGCSNLVSVDIPESIDVIPDGLFQLCENLKNIELPENIKSIGQYAFSGCSRLTEIDIPETVSYIGKQAFSQCSSLEKVSIPEGVTALHNDTFAFCKNLTEVILPDSVKSIENGAFRGCERLTDIKLPDGLTIIDWSVFAFCYALTTVEIPSSVTEIKPNAFSHCYSLSEIVIPANVTIIGHHAFNYCKGMDNITIHRNVKDIDIAAFLECSNLKTVYYEGSEEEWNDISIEIPNEALNNAKIYYNFCVDGHQNIVTEEEIAQTCTEPGFTEGQFCSDCGFVLKERSEIGATGHNWSETETVKAATCTEAGEERKTCVSCGAYESFEIPATGHNWAETETVKAPTCTEAGEEKKTCTSCGAYESSTLTATGHSWSKKEVFKAATCTEDGEERITCLDCGIYESFVIAATGHNIDYIEYVANTCTEDGYCVCACVNCGGERREYVLYRCHDYDWDNAVEVPATCTENGYFDVDCKTCGEHYHGIYYASHSYNEMTVIKEATCTEDGSYTRTCKACGYVDNGIIYTDGHRHDNVVVIKESTCNSFGEYTFTCSRCGYEGSETIFPKEHTYNLKDYKSDTPCTSETITRVICTTCGNEVVFAPGHRGTFIERKEGTCIKKGEYVYRCQICDEIYSEYTSYSLHSDNDNDMLCDVCGREFYEIGLNEKKSFTVNPGEKICVKFTPEKNSQYLFKVYSMGYKSFSLYNTESRGYEDISAVIPDNIYFHSDSNLHKSNMLTKDAVYYLVLSVDEEEDSAQEIFVSVTEYSDCSDGENHSFSKFIPDNNATCTEYGTETMTCSVCGYSISQTDRDSVLTHDFKTSFTETTASSKGFKTYTCKKCGYSYSQAYANGYAVGDRIQYGNYPQSQETDPEILKQLDAADKNWVSFNYYALSDEMLEKIINESVEYPLATVSDYMKYADIDIDGDGTKDYRAVISSAYRYYNTSYTIENPDKYRDVMGEEDYSDYIESCKEQSGGYELNTVYYFKYEPVSWIVLDPVEGLVLSEAVLDSQAYNNCIVLTVTGEEDEYGLEVWGNPEKTAKANDYTNSSIRSWLNNEFYNTAFTAKQKANIAVSKIDNECKAPFYAKWWFGDTAVDYNEFAKEYVDNEFLFYDEQSGRVVVKSEKDSYKSTDDKVFILSAIEATNGDYGFEKDIYGKRDYYSEDYYGGIDIYNNSSRIAESTDYSVLHGGEFYSHCWSLRTSSSSLNSIGTMFVLNNGSFMPQNYQGAFSAIPDTYLGVRPAMRLIELRNDTEKTALADTCEHDIYENEYIAPTCTENGYIGGKVCVYCEKVFETPEIIAPTGHSIKVIPAVPVTCTEGGITEGTVCKVCGEILGGLEPVPAKGHTDSNNDNICDVCGEEIGDIVIVRDSFIRVIANKLASFIDKIISLFRRLFK